MEVRKEQTRPCFLVVMESLGTTNLLYSIHVDWEVMAISLRSILMYLNMHFTEELLYFILQAHESKIGQDSMQVDEADSLAIDVSFT